MAKSGTTLEVDVFVAMQRAADHLEQGLAQVLREHGLTLPQYHVLRSLRGAGPDGLTCGDIKARMLCHDSDVTRLLDRLVRAGLVSRGRSEHDRRAVRTHLTPEGEQRLAALDQPVADYHRRSLAHLEERRLKKLLAYLERVRHHRA